MTEGIQQDDVLMWCSETELLALARKQGLGRLRRGIPKSELVELIRGAIPLQREHHSETMETRRVLEEFIAKNWGQLRSQLPGCDGKCTTFPCTEGKHAMCFYPNKRLLQ